MRDLFPSLYVLAVDKDATIAEYYHCGKGAIVWSPVFIRDAFMDDTRLATFLDKLNEITPLDSPDAVTWNLTLKEFSLSNLII